VTEVFGKGGTAAGKRAHPVAPIDRPRAPRLSSNAVEERLLDRDAGFE
jgi:hypothetical protein